MSVSDDHIVIGLLGPVATGSAGPDRPVEPSDLRAVPGLRAKRLVVSLALAGGRTRSSDRLIADVWSDDPPRAPGAALHTQISRLRQILGTGRIEASGNGYRLVGARTDLDIVDELIADGSPTSLGAAVAWWRGAAGDDLGGDHADDLVAEVRMRAEKSRDALDRARIELALSSGDHATARELAEKRCLADSLDETAHLDLMRALAGQGRNADALAVFADLRRRLSAELGVDPGPAVTAYHTQLLVGEQSVPRERFVRRGRESGLAVETTELFGRDDDVDTILGLLSTHRVVTVQGPGGVGKTRVANRVGHQLADRDSTVYYVALAPIRDSDDVVAAIAATLGVGETDLGTTARPRLAAGDLTERLLDALRGRDTVLILDNCEQVVDRCAQIVAELTSAEPRLRVLATSRAPLMLSSERIYLLPTLDVTERGAAVELFLTRALAVRPGADLPAPEVAELCRQLDGLPLAIELAAARVRTMAVGEISARLTERFALLRGTDRSAPDRHRTLRAVIDWSWELLDHDARDALRRLCRFPAGFTAESAGIVLGYQGFRLDDTLAALVNQSLLTVVESDRRVRYRMLEMVREFGEEMLVADPDASSEVYRAMRTWARRTAADVESGYHSGVDAELMASIGTDADNLVWVLRQCVQVLEDAGAGSSDDADDALDCAVRVFPVLAGFWMARGLHAEVMTWGARILSVLPVPPTDLDDTLRRDWQATVLASMSHQMLHRDLRALATGRFYLRRLHDPNQIYDEPTELITACALSRTPSSAVRHLVRGTASTNERVAIAARSARMNVAENLGLLRHAELDGYAIRDVATQSQDSWMSAMIEVSLGGIAGQQSRWDEAVTFYRRGISALIALGSFEDEMQSRCYLAATLINLGELDEARRELDVVAQGWTPSQPDPQGSPEVAAALMLGFAELDWAQGKVASAAELFARCADLLRNDHPMVTRDPGAAMMVAVAAIGLMRTGQADQARRFVDVLADGVRETFADNGWHDIPQAGNMALAAGYILCDRPESRADGARLLRLADRMRARWDYPSCVAVLRSMRELSQLTVHEWDSVTGDIASMNRREVNDEVQRIMASLVID